MIDILNIQNMILVEQATLTFDKGLNIISGESGSGKSAIMESIALLLGKRADTKVVRKGCTKAVVEGCFNIHHQPKVVEELTSAGIDHEEGAPLIIRREIYASGKSAAFVNHQIIQLSLLRMIARNILHIVSQHSHQQLTSPQSQCESLDLFSDSVQDLNNFQESLRQENALRERISSLKNDEARRLRETEICKMEIEEIASASLQSDEEDELFQEYQRLSNSDTLLNDTKTVTDNLSKGGNDVLSKLNYSTGILAKVSALDPELEEIGKALKSALLELQEVRYSLESYQSKVDANPERLLFVSDRLSLIDRLKRKYGETIDEVISYHDSSVKKLSLLENVDDEIGTLETKLEALSQTTTALEKVLTEKRKKGAKALAQKITGELKHLNMAMAVFEIGVTPQKRTMNGADNVEFMLTPNVGEMSVPVSKCASGGELSRLTLALKAALGSKEKVCTLIFDEVDANIGGETAALVGDKIAEIAQAHQILCITHLPQVARNADQHFCISKGESDGRTVADVQLLGPEKRKEELARMLGGKALGSAAIELAEEALKV